MVAGATNFTDFLGGLSPVILPYLGQLELLPP